MRPSSWNGVGAIAKVPAAWAVSFILVSTLSFVIPGCDYLGAGADSIPPIAVVDSPMCNSTSKLVAPRRPGMTTNVNPSKPPRAPFDLLLGEENLLGVFDDILRLPAGVRRLPAFHLHHSHLAHAARAGDAEHLAGLVARQIADHV